MNAKLVDVGVHVDLDEGELGGIVQLPRDDAVRAQGRDQRDDGDGAGVGEQAGDLPDAPHVLGAVAGGEAEVVGEAVADVVAIEQVRRLTGGHELAFEGDRDRRLARGG